MAQLNADFSVAEGRLGINNPDPYGTLFSLRGERFRIRTDDASTSDDTAWQQTLQQNIVPDLMADPDVARYCNNLKKADGTAAPGIIISFGSTIERTFVNGVCVFENGQINADASKGMRLTFDGNAR